MTSAARWAWILSAVVATGAALVLAFVLSFARPGGFYERHFVWLVWVNAAVALLLVAVLVLVAVRLALRLKRGKFGSRLLVKLAGIFALVGVLPGIVIYAVSYQFAARSIESWFDERMASALDAGLALGKGTLDAFAAELLAKARTAAARLEEQGPPCRWRWSARASRWACAKRCSSARPGRCCAAPATAPARRCTALRRC
ncbi:MAG: hypothetical protein U1F25_14775 [Rubrivivax sp.]